MNKKIITQFKLLIEYIKQCIKENKANGKTKEANVDNFRLRQVKGALNVIEFDQKAIEDLKKM